MTCWLQQEFDLCWTRVTQCIVVFCLMYNFQGLQRNHSFLSSILVPQKKCRQKRLKWLWIPATKPALSLLLLLHLFSGSAWRSCVYVWRKTSSLPLARGSVMDKWLRLKQVWSSTHCYNMTYNSGAYSNLKWNTLKMVSLTKSRVKDGPQRAKTKQKYLKVSK